MQYEWQTPRAFPASSFGVATGAAPEQGGNGGEEDGERARKRMLSTVQPLWCLADVHPVFRNSLRSDGRRHPSARSEEHTSELQSQ